MTKKEIQQEIPDQINTELKKLKIFNKALADSQIELSKESQEILDDNFWDLV